jgi:hypothetical protein
MYMLIIGNHLFDSELIDSFSFRHRKPNVASLTLYYFPILLDCGNIVRGNRSFNLKTCG